eukprot:GHVQ01007459.1.p1 GENE.GHVQ01007459.1~~GHVQ01007459.1.p1  ORF type:complete len:496 (-),score=98.95 GHVQ01007459.1:762-2249(-)
MASLTQPFSSASPIPPSASAVDASNGVSSKVVTQVVRDYLLPVFDKSVNRLVSCDTPDSSLHGQLKLSSHLGEQLVLSRKEADDLRQRLEYVSTAHDKSEKEISGLKHLAESYQIGMQHLKIGEHNARQQQQRYSSQCEKLETQVEELGGYIRDYEAEQQRLYEKAYELERANSQLKAKLSSTEAASKMLSLENHVYSEQVRNSQVSSQHLAKIQGLQQRLDFEQEMSEDRLKEVMSYKETLEYELSKIYEDRNQLYESRKEIAAHRDLLAHDKQRHEHEVETAKQKTHMQKIQLFEENEILRKERDRIEKKLKDLGEDRDKLKQRLKKYRARRKMFELEQKTCKNCNKEYLESENFNWSCRTHQSEYGGEIWWCCGKVGREASGCKYSKHECKEDEDELDEQEKREKEEVQRKIRNQNIRCYACKDVGHKAMECPQDPNLRTRYPADKESRRVELLENSVKTRTAVRRQWTAMCMPDEALDPDENIFQDLQSHT